MMGLGTAILLFLPIFLAVNLIAAIPGREDLKEATRVGLKHFAWGIVIIVVASILLHLLMIWLVGRSPLFT